MQAFSVRRSSWRPIYTEAKHSNTHRQANRGSLWCQSVCERVCVSLCVLISYWASCSAHDWLQTLLILSLGCIAECELHYNSGSKSMSALEAVKVLWGGRNVSLQFKTTTKNNNNDSNNKKNPCVDKKTMIYPKEGIKLHSLLVTLLRKAIKVK